MTSAIGKLEVATPLIREAAELLIGQGNVNDYNELVSLTWQLQTIINKLEDEKNAAA